tara:strand:- start:6217 stop:9297 length:3081 start_codon:yes stop_codon:yes gene_type:complete
MKYDVKLAEDLIVRVKAKNEEEAIQKANEEVNKRVGSEAYDKLNFDYDTGLKNMKLRGFLGLAEKRDQRGREIEKEQVLLNYIGPEGFTYNTKGELAITPDGQKSLIEQGLYEQDDYTDKNVVIDETGYASGDFADFSGVVGPVFGAIATLSPHLRAVGLLKKLVLNERLARMLAAGAGTALGKGGEEAFETQQEVQLQDREELGDLLWREFKWGFGGQGAGELIGTGFHAFFGKKAPVPDIRDAYVVSKGYDMDDVLRLDEKLGRMANEKEIAKAVKKGDVKELGSKGAVSQQFLGRAIPGRMQGIGETIAGKQGRERGLINYNMAALAKLQEKLAAKRAAAKEFSNFQGTGAASGEIRIARDKLKSAEKDVSNYLNKMMGDLSSETGGFGPIMEAMDSAALGKSVQDTMKNSYKSMVDNFRADYDDAFSAIRNFEINQGLKGRIKADLEDLGKYIDDVLDEKSPLLKYRQDEVNLGVLQGLSKEIEKGAYKDGATLSDLIEIRSALVDTQLFAGLRGGKTGEFLSEVLKKVDDIITDAPNKLLYEGRLLATPQQSVLKQTVERLRNINAQYFEDMKPFNKSIVQKIITDSSLLGTSSDDVYRHILTKNDATGMQDVLNALTRGGLRQGQVGPPVQNVKAEKLKTELTRRLFKDAVDTATDPVTGVFNPSKYVKNITQYGSTLRPLLGQNYEKMMSVLNQFNKYSPKLRPEEVAKLADDIRLNAGGEFGPGFNSFLETLETKAKASDELLRFEQSKILTNVENATPETIAQVVFRPNSAASINQVKNQVTEEAFLNVQDEALEQLIKKGVTPGGSDLTEIFKPGNFQRALDSYGDETLEAMFGKDLKMALKGFARAMNVTVSGAEKTGAGSIVAGTLAAGFFNLNLLPTVATLTIYKTLFANPRIVSLMSRTDKTAMGEVLDAVEKAIRLGGFSTLGRSTAEGAEDVERNLRDSGVIEQVPNLREQTKQIIDQVAKPISRGLEIPKVQPIALTQPNQMPISRSLLGGSIANEDIAARRAGIAGLV